MDTEGDFVITWSSYGQEDNGQNGDGWGVYARRYDSYGTPLAPEFQVNVNVGGNQQFSSVAMGEDGNFLIVGKATRAATTTSMDASFDCRRHALQGPLAGDTRINSEPGHR